MAFLSIHMSRLLIVAALIVAVFNSHQCADAGNLMPPNPPRLFSFSSPLPDDSPHDYSPHLESQPLDSPPPSPKASPSPSPRKYRPSGQSPLKKPPSPPPSLIKKSPPSPPPRPQRPPSPPPPPPAAAKLSLYFSSWDDCGGEYGKDNVPTMISNLLRGLGLPNQNECNLDGRGYGLWAGVPVAPSVVQNIVQRNKASSTATLIGAWARSNNYHGVVGLQQWYKGTIAPDAYAIYTCTGGDGAIKVAALC